MNIVMKRWIFPSTYFRSTTSGQSIKITDNKKKEGARKEKRIDLTESANVVCTTSDPAGHCLQPIHCHDFIFPFHYFKY